MRRLTIAFLLIATSAVAHQGVQNADVKARMDLMKEMGASLKVLGQMAKGQRAFDAASANAALSDLRVHAEATPEAFISAAEDPKSEALPAIWEDWDGFTAIADKMAKAAGPDVATLDDLKGQLQAIGQTCSACHEAYRK